jgi:hypothetical protein
MQPTQLSFILKTLWRRRAASKAALSTRVLLMTQAGLARPGKRSQTAQRSVLMPVDSGLAGMLMRVGSGPEWLPGTQAMP